MKNTINRKAISAIDAVGISGLACLFSTFMRTS